MYYILAAILAAILKYIYLLGFIWLVDRLSVPMSLELTALAGSFTKTTHIRHFRRLLSHIQGDFRQFVYILRQTGGHF